jgi:hypothetical protein
MSAINGGIELSSHFQSVRAIAFECRERDSFGNNSFAIFAIVTFSMILLLDATLALIAINTTVKLQNVLERIAQRTPMAVHETGVPSVDALGNLSSPADVQSTFRSRASMEPLPPPLWDSQALLSSNIGVVQNRVGLGRSRF